MDQFTYLLDGYYHYISLGIFILLILAFLSLMIVLSRLNKVKKTYQGLLKGMGNKNLEGIIMENKALIDGLQENYQELSFKVEEIDRSLNSCIKNVALERYDAFPNVGGQQSFSIALLDENGTGVIFSTIQGREDSRTYAKYIIKGMSKHTLSDEERRTIEKALNIK